VTSIANDMRSGLAAYVWKQNPSEAGSEGNTEEKTVTITL
jgi:hypothetical protein